MRVSIRKEVEMRPMGEEDLARVSEIEDRTFSNPWKERTFRGLLGRDDADLWVVALPGEPVIGYVVLWFAADEGELADLAVAEEHRGRGIGALLLARALELAGDRGTRKLSLEVRASNARAVALYQSRGFRVITVRRSYYRKPTEDALVMQLDI